jgi:hypothetical protein
VVDAVHQTTESLGVGLAQQTQAKPMIAMLSLRSLSAEHMQPECRWLYNQPSLEHVHDARCTVHGNSTRLECCATATG